MGTQNIQQSAPSLVDGSSIEAVEDHDKRNIGIDLNNYEMVKLSCDTGRYPIREPPCQVCSRLLRLHYVSLRRKVCKYVLHENED